MRAGDEVLIFTASGTYRGAKGVVRERTVTGAWVLLESETSPQYFERRSIVPLIEEHVGGAE